VSLARGTCEEDVDAFREVGEARVREARKVPGSPDCVIGMPINAIVNEARDGGGRRVFRSVVLLVDAEGLGIMVSGEGAVEFVAEFTACLLEPLGQTARPREEFCDTKTTQLAVSSRSRSGEVRRPPVTEVIVRLFRDFDGRRADLLPELDHA